MGFSVICMCMSIMLIGTAHAAYNYKTGFSNAAGVPTNAVNNKPLTFEEAKVFGTADSGDAMTNILRMNKDLNSTDVILVQGDIVVESLNETTGRRKRNALRDRGARWVNGVVPYVIDNRFDYSTRGRILRAMDRYHATTCIRFVQRSTERDYVSIFPGNGCYSLVGRVGGMQQLSLGNGCTNNLGTIIHELMHAVGFHHEQTRTDRDDFVYIYRQNIIRGLEYNFDKYDQTYIDHLGTPYDYLSVMHYHMTAFTSNGQPTIVARDTRFRLDYRSDFSPNDINKINIYYECGSTPVRPTDPTVVEGECVDMNGNCMRWANSGECDINPSWMLANCKVSCQVCDPDTGTGGGNDDCKDMNENCAYWASVDECNLNPSWMLPNCPESCMQCDTTTDENCKPDMNDNCEAWAQYDQCTVNPGYMLEFCATACGLCSGGLMKNCEDKNENCAVWAANDHCQLNPGYMNYNCRKSCSLCAASSPLELLPQIECQDTNGYCPIYAEDGMCESNPTYMGLACPETCRMCPGRVYTTDKMPENGASEIRSFFGFLGVLVVSLFARRMAL